MHRDASLDTGRGGRRFRVQRRVFLFGVVATPRVTGRVGGHLVVRAPSFVFFPVSRLLPKHKMLARPMGQNILMGKDVANGQIIALMASC